MKGAAVDVDKKEIVALAQRLERLRARRRKIVKVLTTLDGEIREARKFLRDLTEPDPSEAYQAPEDQP